MIDIWDINSRILITFFLAVIAFVMVWKFLEPKSKSEGRKKGHSRG